MNRHVQRVQYRRKREGKTNYRKRLRLLISKEPRLVIRKSSKNILIQLVNHEPAADRVVFTAHSNELKKLGWSFGTGNIPAAYLTGYLAGKKSIVKGYTACIVDIGLQSKGARLFAAVKGAIDAGMRINLDEEIVPASDRIKGAHIAQYAEMLKESEKLNKQFASPDSIQSITRIFEEVKERIK